MSNTLYVPDHVIAGKKDTEKKVLASAYVTKDEKVLDPSLVSKNLKERLPQPTGCNVKSMRP